MEVLRQKIDEVGFTISETGCHIWNGRTNVDGYPVVCIDGRDIPVHRASWALENGHMDPDKLACHSCDTPKCMKAEHIFPGTNQENMQDAGSKGRLSQPGKSRPGELANSSKLSEADVKEILASTDSQKDLAARFGVSRWTIRNIRRGYSWSTVTGRTIPSGGSERDVEALG